MNRDPQIDTLVLIAILVLIGLSIVWVALSPPYVILSTVGQAA